MSDDTFDLTQYDENDERGDDYDDYADAGWDADDDIYADAGYIDTGSSSLDDDESVSYDTASDL